jgi:hypothetical protein
MGAEVSSGAEGPGNQRAPGQFVVDLYRVAGPGHVGRAATLVQVAACVRVNVQLLVHALRQHDGGRCAGRELPGVGGAGCQGSARCRFRPGPSRVRRPDTA